MRVLACGVPVVGTTDGSALLRVDDDAAADHGDRLAALAGTLRPHLDAGETVVALWPQQDGEELHRHLQAVRSALDTSRLVLHPSPLPPLAVALLANSLAELAAAVTVAPGVVPQADGHGTVASSVLASGVGRLERLICGGAWLGSVAKLRHPTPSVAMHARSWLPSAAFGGAVSAEHAELTRLHGEAVLPLPSLAPAGDWQVWVSDHGGDAGTVRRSLDTRAPDVERLVVAPAPASVTWWGTDKLIEVAIAPRGVDRLRRALLADRTPSRCGWCDAEVLTDPCPLCGARTTATTDDPLAPGAPA
jgi:hypothetical protein